MEYIAAFISAASLISIVFVLAAYNKHPVPPLMKGVTLNAIISFLATISRTSILVCIGTVLAERKWLWFQKQRSLADLQQIENASRGPLGSLVLLFNARGGIVCGCAATLTIAALVFDPFIQQLLTTSTVAVEEFSEDVYINATRSFLPREAMGYPESAAEIAGAMLAKIQQYQASPDPRMKRSDTSSVSAVLTLLQPQCVSGNCKWPRYYALDICTACRPTTGELVFTNVTYSRPAFTNKACDDLGSSCYDPYKATVANWTWEIRPKYGNVATVRSSFTENITSNDQGNDWTVDMVRKVVWPRNFGGVSDIGLLNVSGWNRQAFAGIDEPIASIGFAEFNADVVRGLPKLHKAVVQELLETRIIETHYGSVTRNDSNRTSLVWSAVVDGTNFSSINGYYGAVIDTVVGLLLGNSTHTYSGGCGIDSKNCQLNQTDNNGVYATHPDAWQGIDLTEDFSTVLKNVENVVSQIMQRYGVYSIIGSNVVTKQIVYVRWPWITLPATVTVLGLVVLGLTVWESTSLQAPNWKSSLLPLFYRYTRHDSNDARSTQDGKSFTSMKRKPVPGDEFRNSNATSRFELEAEATIAQISRTPTEDAAWQFRTVHVRHRVQRRWWHRHK